MAKAPVKIKDNSKIYKDYLKWLQSKKQSKK